MLAYFDLVSGISGDMLLGCLVDAGWPIDRLRAVVSGLGLADPEWSVDAAPVMRGPLHATRVEVRAAEGHRHRHLKHVRAMIEEASLTDSVRAKSISIFERLARAEAKVHGTTPDKVHFHEVGAVDAIIDVVGGVAGLEELGVDAVFCSAFPLGEGWTDSAHGRIPLPAPATLELLSEAGAPVRPALGPGEWVTPTGAAIMTELAAFSQPVMTLERMATGAGGREAPWPNVARMWLGAGQARGGFIQIDTNIDDMSPQVYASVAERLFAAGARDVWLTPIQMKKGRPAVLLSLIAPAQLEAPLADLLLRETTTLGVRVHPLVGRHDTRHEMREVTTEFGPIPVKVKWLHGSPAGASPEYEACASVARRLDVPLKTVLDAAAAEAHRLVADIRTRTGGPSGPP